MRTEDFMQTVLDQKRSAVLQSIQDDTERMKTDEELRRLDRIVQPLMLQMYHQHGGDYTDQRAHDEALRHFRANADTAKTAEALARYLQVRWAAYRNGLKSPDMFRPAANEIGKNIGAMIPMRTERSKLADSLTPDDQKYVNQIHLIARQNQRVNPLALHMQRLFSKDNMVNFQYSPAQTSVQVLQSSGVPLTLSRTFMHPLVVLLGAVENKQLNRRLIEADLARVVSGQLNGAPQAALRTQADRELWYDMTHNKKITNFCSPSLVQDMVRRCNIQRFTKSNITAFRSGMFSYGSYDFIEALRTCRQSPLDNFVPDHAVDMLYKITNSLALYPTVVQTLPNHVMPNQPIPMGEATRVPFLRVMLPRPGDNRYLDLADNWCPREHTLRKLVNGKLPQSSAVVQEPVYSLLPDRIGKRAWVQTPWNTIQNSTMKIIDSRALLLVPDRRLPPVGGTSLPFQTPEQQTMLYMDSYRINRSKVNVLDEITLELNENKKLNLAGFLALEHTKPKGSKHEYSCGYRTYIPHKGTWYRYAPNNLLQQQSGKTPVLQPMNTRALRAEMQTDKEQYGIIYVYE